MKQKANEIYRRKFLHLAGVTLAGATTSRLARGKKPPQGERPNILIVMVDQQFADAMSCVIGNEYINTPAMDSLAANGMRFSRAYCANHICQPSRTATFTTRKNFKKLVLL